MSTGPHVAACMTGAYTVQGRRYRAQPKGKRQHQACLQLLDLDVTSQARMQEGDQVGVAGVPPKQHFTKAPPRYSEANLVKTLQEKGIGRPSTYGVIISGLQVPLYIHCFYVYTNHLLL